MEEKETNKMKKLIFNHKAVSTLILIIIIILGYFFIKINNLKNEIAEIGEKKDRIYSVQLDSVKLEYLKQIGEVFSWSVRSELIRNNLEQINQFFLTFVDQQDVQKINLINAESNKIILSTDKKNEGQQITEKQIINATDLKLLVDPNQIQVVVPIMGLNKQIGTLVIEYTR